MYGWLDRAGMGGEAGLSMRIRNCHYGDLKDLHQWTSSFGAMKKRTKTLFLILLLCLPGKVLFSEQNREAPLSWIPPTGSNPRGMEDTSITQMLTNPISVATFFVWLSLFVLFVLCLLDLIMKVAFYGCSSSVQWCTSSQHLRACPYHEQRQ